jgi:hypothetical protein
MTRKRELSRGLLIPGEDDGDTSSLFDDVLGADLESGAGVRADDAAAKADVPGVGTPVVPEAVPLGEPEAPEAALRPTPVADTVPPMRPILSAGPVERTAEKPAGPGRYVFEPNKLRDFAIFLSPIAGDHIVELLIKDPYACARHNNRQHLVDFMKQLAGAARRIDAVTCHTLDAESVENWDESDTDQRSDLERRWQASFAASPSLRHIQISKRINRTFHAREITARFASGRTILWDLDNGIDGVMRRDRRCVVGCFPQ